MKFFVDLLKEEGFDKFSSKKIWGHICMILVSVTYVLDGWDFYNINTHLFDSLLIAGTTLLGLASVAKIFTKKEPKKNENE